jgi:ABC-type transport system involved in multi-copper enzyme maturation permease subunit
MTILPIAVRELRVASRRRATYWMRTALGGLAAVCWLLLLFAAQRAMRSDEMAKILFGLLGGLALAFGMFAGVVSTADCLSEERREGTLGLLFLTPLRAYDVIAGKLIASLLPTLFGLLTIIPVLALPMLMGGVSFPQFCRVGLALVLTLVWSLSLGIGISTFCREARSAVTLTLLLVVTLAGLLPLAGWGQSVWTRSPTWPIFLWWSPAYLFAQAFDAFYQWGRPVEFWGALSMVAGTALASLIASNLRLPRAWREGGEERAGAPGWKRILTLGTARWRAARRPLMEKDPFYWLATRDRAGTWLGSIIIVPLFLIWAWLWLGCAFGSRGNKGDFFSFALLAAIVLHMVLKWLAAMEASRRFGDDHRSGALELLLVTPLAPEHMVGGQRRALRRAFRTPMILAALTNAGFLLLFFVRNPMGFRPRDTLIFSEWFVAGVVMLLLDFATITYYGMWVVLRARTHNRAIMATIGRVSLLPLAILLMLWFVAVTRRSSQSTTIAMVSVVWQCLAVALDAALLFRAARALRTNFRALAAREDETGGG